MKKQILFLLSALLMTAGLWTASAQGKIEVRGTVLDDNGLSVIGAGVMEKGILTASMY